MIVIGDSIMWGQGLLKEQKFYYQVARWLETDVFRNARIVPEPLLLAHSDANIFPAFDQKKDFIKNNVSGETDLPNPAILFQAESALEHFKNRERPGNTGPATVDLILLNGGINDFGVERFLKLGLSASLVDKYAKQYCGHGMRLLLTFLASAFPNARMVVVGYYQIISRETHRDFVRKAVMRKIFGSSPKWFFNIPFFDENRRLRDEFAKRSEWWLNSSNTHLEDAVKSVNRSFPVSGDRVVFVPTPFRPENSYGTGKQSLLWELNDAFEVEDPMSAARAVTCKQDGKRSIRYEICKRAAAFHPNPAGAAAYAEKIKEAVAKLAGPAGWSER